MSTNCVKGCGRHRTRVIDLLCDYCGQAEDYDRIVQWEKDATGIQPELPVEHAFLKFIREKIEVATAWRTIDTAPKDGTILLSYYGDTPQFIIWISNDGWRVLLPSRDGGFGIHGNFGAFHPTHWLPVMPAPPTSTEDN